jgi:hypothetical protein
MALAESVGDPNLTVGLSLPVIYAKIESAEWCDVLRLSQRVIELADGDPSKGDFLFECPLALAYTSRAIARWCLGRPGWRDDLRHGLAMASTTDPVSHGWVVGYVYNPGIPLGVLRLDDSAVREIEDALQVAERSGDDLALSNARLTLGVALVHRDTAAERDRGQKLLAEVSDVFLRRGHNLGELPIVNVYLARERARRGDRDSAIPLMRAAVDDLVRHGQLLSWGVPATGVLVETLLDRGAESDVAEAEAAITRLADAPADDGLVIREIWLLRLRALLARAEGDEAAYRDYRDRYRAMATSLGFGPHVHRVTSFRFRAGGDHADVGVFLNIQEGGPTQILVALAQLGVQRRGLDVNPAEYPSGVGDLAVAAELRENAVNLQCAPHRLVPERDSRPFGDQVPDPHRFGIAEKFCDGCHVTSSMMVRTGCRRREASPTCPPKGDDEYEPTTPAVITLASIRPGNLERASPPPTDPKHIKRHRRLNAALNRAQTPERIRLQIVGSAGDVKDRADLPWFEARDQSAGLFGRDSDKVNVSASSLRHHLWHDRQRAMGPGADDQPGSAPGEFLVGRQRSVSELVAVWLRGLLAPFAHSTSVDDDVMLIGSPLDLDRPESEKSHIHYVPP